jgi:serine/threonine-protein kinase RIO1
MHDVLYVNKPLCYTMRAICFLFHKSLDVHGDISGYGVLHEGDICLIDICGISI